MSIHSFEQSINEERIMIFVDHDFLDGYIIAVIPMEKLYQNGIYSLFIVTESMIDDAMHLRILM